MTIHMLLCKYSVARTAHIAAGREGQSDTTWAQRLHPASPCSHTSLKPAPAWVMVLLEVTVTLMLAKWLRLKGALAEFVPLRVRLASPI